LMTSFFNKTKCLNLSFRLHFASPEFRGCFSFPRWSSFPVNLLSSRLVAHQRESDRPRDNVGFGLRIVTERSLSVSILQRDEPRPLNHSNPDAFASTTTRVLSQHL
jgi:hypothetical protein